MTQPKSKALLGLRGTRHVRARRGPWPTGPRTHLPLVFLGLSIAAHASLILVLRSSPLARERVATVARFVGTTFEIEALFTDFPSESASSSAGPDDSPSEDAALAKKSGPSAVSTKQGETRPDEPRVSRRGRARPEEPSESSRENPSPPASLEKSLFDKVLAFQPGASRVPPPPAVSDGASNTKAAGDAGATTTRPKYGAEGLPTGIVELRAAFTKTLPLAAKSDLTWSELPLGAAGQVDVELRISPGHDLEEIRVIERPGHEVPEHLERMVRINRSYLMRGRFAVDTTGKTGVQRLRVIASIFQGEPDRDTPEASGVNRLGQLGGSDPKGAYFAYFSGRRVEFQVQALPR